MATKLLLRDKGNIFLILLRKVTMQIVRLFNNKKDLYKYFLDSLLVI